MTSEWLLVALRNRVSTSDLPASGVDRRMRVAASTAPVKILATRST